MREYEHTLPNLRVCLRSIGLGRSWLARTLHPIVLPRPENEAARPFLRELNWLQLSSCLFSSTLLVVNQGIMILVRTGYSAAW